MCNCTTLPDGNITLCDECTATVQAMLKECGITSIELVNPVTPSEYRDIKAVMADWPTDQQGGKHEQHPNPVPANL